MVVLLDADENDSRHTPAARRHADVPLRKPEGRFTPWAVFKDWIKSGVDDASRECGRVRKTLVETKEALGRALRNRDAPLVIYLPSFMLLGTADVVSGTTIAAGAAGAIGAMGVVGGVGVIAASVLGNSRAKTSEDKLDAASDFAWGAQGLFYLVSSKVTMQAALGLGLIGGLTQTYVGARRIWQALKDRNQEKLRLGALDICGGLLWLGWDVLGFSQPLVVGSYVVLMVAREVYASRQDLARLGRRLLASPAPVLATQV